MSEDGVNVQVCESRGSTRDVRGVASWASLETSFSDSEVHPPQPNSIHSPYFRKLVAIFSQRIILTT